MKEEQEQSEPKKKEKKEKPQDPLWEWKEKNKSTDWVTDFFRGREY